MATTLIARSTQSRVRDLTELAIHGLTAMYHSDRGLFCRRVTQSPAGLVREGFSHRYTLITLLGLARAESVGMKSFVQVESSVFALLSDTAWIRNIGDLGLLLWLCALTSEDHLKLFFNTFDLQDAFQRYAGRAEERTMELAWFLSGLAHAAETNRQLLGELESLATETYQLILLNQGPHGIFGHQSRWRSLTGAARGHIGSFADQVYPIYAMTQFSTAYKVGEASEHALRCAQAICDHQGPLGQWWWHYNSVTGRIVEHYPVFSVHQDGMGPMALFALQRACGANFQEQIYQGLDWIYGTNELQEDLTDAAAGVIWRNIHQPRTAVYSSRVRTLLGQSPSLDNLRVLYECRPYHLGWLLYAFSPLLASDSCYGRK